MPGYLKKGWKEERWQRVANFRLGDGMRGSRYWEREERKVCRVCGCGEKTWKHVWEKCTGWGREKSGRIWYRTYLGKGGGGRLDEEIKGTGKREGRRRN